MTRRTNSALALLSVMTLAGAALTFATPAQAVAGGCANPTLSSPARAGDVQKSNPSAFQAAATRNARSVPHFADRAKHDRTLWLDRCGSAFYVDGGPTPTDRAAATASMGAAAAPSTLADSTVPLTDTFTLNSHPGSKKTIYLDFKGGTVTGTAWNQSYGGTITAEPYSIDATVDTNFSDAELTEIQKAWQVVAEDYAPFDVNVTTQDPGAAALDRSSSTDDTYGAHAMITNGGVVYNACGCGGVAYVNVFNSSGSTHNYYQPAWIFSNGTTKNGKYMGEAISHEIGHNFGLNHDATSTAGYYSGSTPWAPIMGASYSQPVSQWSKGEYPDANNFEDDLAIIASGAAVRADEDPTGPLSLTNGGVLNGIVTSAADTDSYAFTAAGSTTLTVNNAAGFPDLDVQLTITDAGGNVVAVVDPTTTAVSATQATGMNAAYSFTAPVAGATYTATIQGAGQGTPGAAGSYSAYASIGNYQVSLSTQSPSNPTPLTIGVAPLPAGTVGTAYSTSPVTGSGGLAPYSYSATGLPAGLSINASTGAVTGTPTTAGSFAPVFTVTDAAAATASQSAAVTIAPAPVFVAAQSFSRTVGASASSQVVATGGTGSFTWAATGGTLPPGTAFSSAGVLSGTPTTAGTYSFSATATSNGASGTGTITVTVAAASAPLAFLTGATLPAAKNRTAYSTTISVTGGSPAYTWTRTSGSLPNGLTLTASGASATVSGTPTKAGNYSFTLRVTDSKGVNVSRTFTIRVNR